MPIIERGLNILRRRGAIGAIALLVPVAAAAGFALCAPRTYRSSAVVVVERGNAGSDDDVDARLSALTNDNLRRARLYNLIARFNLYQGMGRHTSAEVLIDQMQKDMRIDVDKEERGGRSVANAVHVSFTADDPQVASDVANDLAAFYQREDRRMREERGRYRLARLTEQLADARKQLDVEEKRLRDYKAQHLSELPEQVNLHLAALEQLNSQVRSNRIGSDAVGREASPDRRTRPPAEHDERLTRLRELETRYTADHPDVRRLRREIAILSAGGKPEAAEEAESEDPATSRAAVEAAERARVESIRRKNDELRQAAAVHEQGILNAPFRQQELEALLPDYVAARTRYQSLSEKYEIAQLWDPEYDDGRLRILDPAVPRGQPVAPSLTRIMSAGIALGLVAMFCVIAAAERIDSSFHTLEDLRGFTTLPVLASVPRLPTTSQRRRDRHKLRRFAATGLAAVMLAFACAAYVSHGHPAFVALLGQSRH